MGETAEILQLWKACYSGDADLVEELISDEAVDYAHRDRNGESVLHMAARSDRVEVLNVLLEYIDPNVANNNRQTSLHLAAIKGHVNVVEALIDAGCDLDTRTKFSEMTALHLACQHDRRDVVKVLLRAGAVCYSHDTIGKRPDFYTTNPKIQRLFDKHRQRCTHEETFDRGDRPKTTSTEQSDNTATSTEHAESPEGGGNSQELASETPPNLSRLRRESSAGRKARKLLKMAGKKKKKKKKVKVNHSMEFSEEYMKRMNMNVFDRLGGKKK